MTTRKQHAQAIADSIVKDGGITVGPNPGDQPLPVGNPQVRKYIVGGSRVPGTRGARYPESRVPVSSFGGVHVQPYVDYVKEARQSGATNTYVGGWTSDGDAVMDVANAYNSPRQALVEAVRRREDAIFATRGIQEIPTPREPWTTRPGFSRGEAQGHLFRERTPSEELRSVPEQHKITGAVQQIVQQGW